MITWFSSTSHGGRDYGDEHASRLETHRLKAYLLVTPNIFVDLRAEVE